MSVGVTSSMSLKVYFMLLVFCETLTRSTALKIYELSILRPVFFFFFIGAFPSFGMFKNLTL